MAKRNTDNIVSVMIEGKGRFYAWGKTRADAERDLVLGLVRELEYANKSLDNLFKADRAMRQAVDKAISLSTNIIQRVLR